jgi:hypothetical protein
MKIQTLKAGTIGRLSQERRTLLAISLAGTLLVVPWELFMAFGFTFTFRAHEPLTAWLFVWFTFLLNIPAVLCSWLWPRLAGFWLIGNVAISLAIGIGFELMSFVQAPRSAASEFFNGIFGLIYTAVFFWGPPLMMAAGLLLMPMLTRTDPARDES